jgi:Flp pilus assembly pilin Flp
MRMRAMLGDLRADERGVAAIETGLVGTILIAMLLNVIEVSRYAYISTQVNAATQAAVQAAVVACDTNHSPVLANCPALSEAVSTAMHGTSLGDDVALQDNMSERWYCVSANDKLEQAGGASSTCSAGGKPALYLKIRTTYPYRPLFPGLTIAEAFSDSIQHTAWMRTL